MDNQTIEKHIINAIIGLQSAPGEWVEISMIGSRISNVPRHQKLLKFLEMFGESIATTRLDSGIICARLLADKDIDNSLTSNEKCSDEIEAIVKLKLDELEPSIREYLENPLGEVMKNFGVYLIKLLNNAKKNKMYAIDSGYDYSTYAESTGEDIDLTEYETVEDLLNEFTGDSRPTFCSGNGMFAQTYRDLVLEDAAPMVYVVILKEFPQLDQAILGDTHDFQHDIVVEYLMERDLTEILTIQKFSEMSVDDLIANYRFAANAELSREERENKRNSEYVLQALKEKEAKLVVEANGSYDYVKNVCLLAMRMTNQHSFTKPMLTHIKKQIELDGREFKSKSIQSSLSLIFGKRVIPCSNSVSDKYFL